MLSTIKEVEGRISAYYSRYKFFLIRNDKIAGGVQILLAEDAFVEVEKVIDSVSLEVLWWTKRYIVVTQMLVSTLQALYTNVKSGVCMNNSFPNTFHVQMGGY